MANTKNNSVAQMKLVESFIKATPKWIDQLKPMRGISGHFCPMCGCDFDNFLVLVEALKNVVEKAHIYDSLCR